MIIMLMVFFVEIFALFGNCAIVILITFADQGVKT